MSALDDAIAGRHSEEERQRVNRLLGQGYREATEINDDVLDLYRDFVARLPVDAGVEGYFYDQPDGRRTFHIWPVRQSTMRRSEYNKWVAQIRAVVSPVPARVLVIADKGESFVLVWTADRGWRAADGLSGWYGYAYASRSAMVNFAIANSRRGGF